MPIVVRDVPLTSVKAGLFENVLSPSDVMTGLVGNVTDVNRVLLNVSLG